MSEPNDKTNPLVYLQEKCRELIEETGEAVFRGVNEDGEPYCTRMNITSADGFSESFKGGCGYMNLSKKVWKGPDADSAGVLRSVQCYVGCDYCPDKHQKTPKK